MNTEIEKNLSEFETVKASKTKRSTSLKKSNLNNELNHKFTKPSSLSVNVYSTKYITNKDINFNMNQEKSILNNSNISHNKNSNLPRLINSKKSQLHINNQDNKNIILIVDDNITILKAINSLIYKFLVSKKIERKYQIIMALDGIEALNLVYSDVINNFNSIKLIISDEMMNYMNGSELYSNLETKIFEKRREKIPFVICSAFSNISHFEKMHELGVDFYKKPLSKGNVEFLFNKYFGIN